MRLAPGDVFAGYTIEQPLGAGGMGEVYLARHPRIPRPYALKILAAGDDEFRARFIREADLAADLSHPNIVGVHDRGEADGRLWIAMDYVEGADAGRLLREHYPSGMPLPDVIQIATAVAAALDYAHGRRLLHRDVKPANILLDGSPGPDRRILLADFGIGRKTDEISGLTATNVAIGAVASAAPEQLLGRPLDGRADQYALAATTFQLLTGESPFAHSNPAVAISKHVSEPPPRLAERRPELAALDPVFAVALAKDPAARFPSCAAFAHALATALPYPPQPAAAQPSYPWPTQYPASPTGFPADMSTAPARPSSAAAILVPILLALLLVGALVFAATQFLRPAPPSAPQAQPYLDTATTFAETMFTYTRESADGQFEHMLDLSTGGLHDELEKSAEKLKGLLTNGGSSSCTINGIGLESLSGPDAAVLVALRSTVTDAAGVQKPSTPYRLKLLITQVDGVLKVADLAYPDGGN